jgi:hypothetical protein
LAETSQSLNSTKRLPPRKRASLSAPWVQATLKELRSQSPRLNSRVETPTKASLSASRVARSMNERDETALLASRCHHQTRKRQFRDEAC